MKHNDNLSICHRLLDLSKNELVYNVYPGNFKSEYIFLANALNDSISRLEHEFDDAFKNAVGTYKASLREGKGYGWFHAPEKLCYIRMQINQLLYAVYGDQFCHELVFREELGKMAYKDLIEQIDRTAIMTQSQLKSHNKKIEKISADIVKELLKEENNGKES